MISRFIILAILGLSLCFLVFGDRPLVGGWTDLNVEDENVKNLTLLALDRYNKQTNSINLKQLVRIKSAKAQLVSGRKFAITFTIGETLCSKNGIQKRSAKECPITNTSTIETCSVVIWQRAWLKEGNTQILDIKCCPSDNTIC